MVYAMPGKKCKFVEDSTLKISTQIGCGVACEHYFAKGSRNGKQELEVVSDLAEYVSRIDEIIKKKQAFFK